MNNDHARKILMFALVILMAMDGVVIIIPFLILYIAWAVQDYVVFAFVVTIFLAMLRRSK